jgi:hypothetical protein
VIYTIYSYIGEVFVLLAGFGMASPVMAFLAGDERTPPARKISDGTIAQFLGGSWMGYVGLSLLVLWGLMKYFVVHEDLEKRCSLLKSYRRHCAQLRERVRRVLQTSDPMPELIQIQMILESLVDRSIAERAIPDDPVDEKLKGTTEKYCNELIDGCRSYWTASPAQERSPNVTQPVIAAAS